MTSITALDVVDIRFPTSRWLDGSDAMNPEPDYSAAYVVLRTDETDVVGCSLLFTTGRGNDVACAAVRSLSSYVLGRDVATLIADVGALARELTWDGQLRWLGPEKGVMHMAIGAVVNAAWDLRARVDRQPLWRVLSALTPSEIVQQIDFTYIDDAITPAEAVEHLEALASGRAGRIAALESDGLPAYTTSAGWLGYDDDKVERLTKQAIAEGFTMLKLKVGTDVESDVRRMRIARMAAGPDVDIAVDANQRWGLRQAIEWMARLAPYDPYWIEEPTSPDDVLGHRTIRQAVRPIRVATGEHVQNRVIFKQLLQAEAIDVVQIDACRVGGVNENLAILLLAAKFGVPVCPHAGGVGLCEMVQHLANVRFRRGQRNHRPPVGRIRRSLARALHRPGDRRARPVPSTALARRRRPNAADLDRRVPLSRGPGLGHARRMTRRIDSHHHLWDLNDRDQPWMIGPQFDPVRRDFDVDDLRAAIDGLGIDGTVVVQSAPDVAETQELLDLACVTPLIVGVVGYVDVRAPDVGEQLDRLIGRPSGSWLVGIRSLVQYEPDPDWLGRPDVVRGLREIASRGLAFDLLVRLDQIEATLAALDRVAEGRFVLDHLAKPNIASRSWQPWARAITALAERPNLTAKVSGLSTEADWTTWTTNDLRPYVDHAFGVFGARRLMFGSDWPVSLLAASYRRTVETIDELTEAMSDDERQAVRGGTAQSVYRLNTRGAT